MACVDVDDWPSATSVTVTNGGCNNCGHSLGIRDVEHRSWNQLNPYEIVPAAISAAVCCCQLRHGAMVHPMRGAQTFSVTKTKSFPSSQDYPVPSDLIEQLFTNPKIKGSSYDTTKDIAHRAGVDVTKVRNPNDDNTTLLHIAAGWGRRSWVIQLITDGADVDARDYKGQTPLHMACNHAHKTVAMILIDEGADINQTDLKGWTALRFSLSRLRGKVVQPQYWELIEVLLALGADPYLECTLGENSFTHLKDVKQRLSMKVIHLLYLLDNTHKSNNGLATIDKYLRVSDFFELVRSANEDFINYPGLSTVGIIKRLVTPRLMSSHLKSCDDITPLHRAAGYGHLEVAQLFIESGADPNNEDRDGRIPLHNAAMYGHLEMIDLLASKGSNVDRQDASGYTPLHVAAKSEMDSTFMACLKLIELGASKKIRSFAGELPYDLAQSDEVKQVLMVDKEFTTPSTSDPNSTYVDPGRHTYQRPTSHLAVGGPDENLMLDSNSSEPLFANTQHESKVITLAENDPKYRLVKQRMLETIVSHANDLGGRFGTYEILSIKLILHKRVWSVYRLACQMLELQHGSKNEKLLFHGSTFIDDITAHGFQEGYAQRNGMFGAGIYFASHSSKSNQYAFGLENGCKLHNDKSCYKCERKMIYAQVALGRSKVCQDAIPDLAHAPPHYSSVTGQPGITANLTYPEYVIYSGGHAYPLFVITYRIKPE